MTVGCILSKASAGAGRPCKIMLFGGNWSLGRCFAGDSSLGAEQAVERNRLGEFGSEAVAGSPFDDRIGAPPARQH